MFGEEMHAAGVEGVQNAKRWLDATTRADVHWIFPNEAARPRLSFKWADGRDYAFDIGGLFRGGDLANRTFLGEVKNYKTIGGQPEMYREYLAGCYRARQLNPSMADQFMWITWNPFLVDSWAKLTTADEVRAAVIKYSKQTLGVDPEQAETHIPAGTCEAVAESLWLLVLSSRHELLMLSLEDRKAVIAAQMDRGMR